MFETTNQQIGDLLPGLATYDRDDPPDCAYGVEVSTARAKPIPDHRHTAC